MISDDREPTVCPFTLKETELTADECIILDVYAEQYDIKSNNKTYRICYNSKSCWFVFSRFVTGLLTHCVTKKKSP